jgi:hypothetical protein
VERVLVRGGAAEDQVHDDAGGGPDRGDVDQDCNYKNGQHGAEEMAH